MDERTYRMLMTGEGLDTAPSADGHVLQFLGNLDRPRNAVASAVYNLVDDDPATGFWQGLSSGWGLGKRRSWGDVFGLEPTTPQDTWMEYIAKGAPRLVSDILLDPLNLLFGTGAITKGLGLSKHGISALGRASRATGLPQQAGAAFRGSQLGKLFSHSSGDETVEALLRKAVRETDDAELREIADATRSKYFEEMGRRGFAPERAEEIARNELLQSLEKGRPVLGETPEGQKLVDWSIMDIIEPLRKYQYAKEMERRGALEQFNIVPRGMLNPEKYIPHLLTGLGRKLSKKKGLLDDTFDEHSRTIVGWRDPEGHLLTVGKLGHPGTGVIKKGDNYFYEGVPVTKDPHATIREIYEHQVLKPGSFIEDPFAALALKSRQSMGKTAYTNLLKGLSDSGHLFMSPSGKRDVALPAGYRWLEVKGFDAMAAPKAVANRMENASHLFSQTAKATTKIEQFFQAIFDTELGQGLTAYTSWWKRNTLMTPGFFLANSLSDCALIYLSGVRNPKRIGEGVATVTKQGGKSPIAGFSYADLHDAFRIRRGIGSQQVNLLGDEIPDTLTRELTQIPYLAQMTSKLGTPGKGVLAVGDRWRKVNDWAFQKFGASWEDTAKSAVAIDWLKKHVKGTPTPTQLDQAVAHAHDFLFDYHTGLTHFERALKNYFPFISWFRSIVGRTLTDLTGQPHQLAHIGRFFDFTLTPLSPDERASAPEWVEERGPVRGILGQKFQSKTGLPMIGLSGRFMPHGTIEELLNRPGETLMNMINPIFKAPFEMTGNYSYFKQRPIDEIALGGAQAMMNPVTGGPYSVAKGRMFGANMPAMWQHILESYSPIGRHARTLNELTRGTLYDDPNKPAMSPGEKAAYTLSGAKIYPYDPVRQRYYKTAKEDRQGAAIKRQLRRSQKIGDWQGVEFYGRQLREWARNREKRSRAHVEIR